MTINICSVPFWKGDNSARSKFSMNALAQYNFGLKSLPHGLYILVTLIWLLYLWPLAMIPLISISKRIGRFLVMVRTAPSFHLALLRRQKLPGKAASCSRAASLAEVRQNAAAAPPCLLCAPLCQNTPPPRGGGSATF